MRHLLPILLIAACNDYKVTDVDPPPDQIIDAKEPCLVLDPARVEFVSSRVAQDPAQDAVVTVRNDCEGDLEIYGLALDADAEAFSLGRLGAVLLSQGESTTFDVRFDPQTAREWSSRALLDTNDPELPQAGVELVGTGIAPVIQVTPQVYDFGTPYIGCGDRNLVEIRNAGNADLLVEEIEFAATSVDFVYDPDEATNGLLPWTLTPGSAATVFVDYLGLDAFADEAFLTVTSNDPFTPQALARSSGAALYYGANHDSFEQSLQAATDILFTLDRSGSMYDDNEAVIANFDSFLNTLVDLDADYQVAVIVNDDGCVVGPQNYIDSSFSASAAESTFATMADIDGNYGYYTEAGFALADAALSAANTGPGGCNFGLLRNEAVLSIVHVSDEVEQSPHDPNYYVQRFRGLKGNDDDLVMNAVAGDYPGGCSTADPGEGYYQATAATGGLFLSICSDDWGTNLEELAERSVTLRSSFRLTDPAVASTLEVSVNGARTTTGWTFNPFFNSVNFDRAHVPAGGSTVEVSYQILPQCD